MTAGTEPSATISCSSSSWWQSSSWFASGLHEPQQSAPVEPTDGTAQNVQDGGEGMAAPGGARAQSRFGGKTAMPIYRSAPVDGAPVLNTSKQMAPVRPVPHSNSKTEHAALGLDGGRHHLLSVQRQGAGYTCDGLPAPVDSQHAHVSRWQFDLDTWRWLHKGEAVSAGAPEPPAAKHLLAARRWGDSRDTLAAALDSATAAGAQSTGGGGGKRQRLEVEAVRGGGSPGSNSAAAGRAPAPDGFASVGGLAAQKEALLRSVAYPLRHPSLFSRLGVPALRGVLLHGPPGTGKSHLARALAAEARLPLVAVNCAECAGEDGAARLRRAFAEAKSVAPSLLLLDEIDAAAPATQGATSEAQRQLSATLVAAVDALRASGARVAVLAATNRRECTDPALRRAGRLDVEVGFGALSRCEREEVLECASRGMPLAPDVSLPRIAGSLHGYTAADCAAVCTEAALRCAVEVLLAAAAGGGLDVMELKPDHTQELAVRAAVRAAHFEAALQALGPASLRELTPELPEVDWTAIGGLQEVKAELRELVELPTSHGALLQAMGVRPPRGALLYGPPGCGKTLLAKAVASQCGANFLSVRGPELLQKWLGESERGVRELFAAARAAAPAVLFFDEVDALAPRRGGGGAGAVSAGDGAAARVLNQLLVEMDGLSAGARGAEGCPPLVLVLAATNRPEALDPALMRPGRLDRLLLVPLPDEESRRQVLSASLARCPLALDVDLVQLAAGTEGMSGADLGELVRRAGMAAIREMVAAQEAAAEPGAAAQADAERAGGSDACAPGGVLTWRHLQDALAGLQPSVSPAEVQRYKQLEEALRHGSLPDGGSAQLTAAQKALVRALVARAQGQQSEREAALARRVQVLEHMVSEAGLEVPPLAEDGLAEHEVVA